LVAILSVYATVDCHARWIAGELAKLVEAFARRPWQ